MSFHSLKYLLVYVTPGVVAYSLWSNGFMTYAAILLLFGVIPLMELFTVGSTKNLSEIEEELVKKDRTYDFLLYSLVPIQYGLLIFFLIQISEPNHTLMTKLGMTTALGMACGVLGINAAHELGHRNTWYEQFMSKILLLTTLYMHFFIEHNRGHHKNVSTADDPASSRYGENIYSFYFRTISGSWFSAWHLEKERLAKEKHNYLTIHNEMIQFQLLQLALIITIYIIFGSTTLLYFLIAALIGILLLETVNYIEHYGLRRKKNGERYERTMPIHSWNSNHPLGRMILLELSRHSDHHYMSNRKYQLLRHYDESPQMPTGYPGMMLLSFIPPLWFAVMHKKIKQYKQTNQGEALAS
jgi:alkane 1-monooxygenase